MGIPQLIHPSFHRVREVGYKEWTVSVRSWDRYFEFEEICSDIDFSSHSNLLGGIPLPTQLCPLDGFVPSERKDISIHVNLVSEPFISPRCATLPDHFGEQLRGFSS
jgi:hypothetical protein